MKKYTAVFEDTVMQYNKWVAGVASRDMSTTPVRMSPKKPGTKLPNTTPPVLDGLSQILGCLVLNLANLQQKLNVAIDSNLSEKKDIIEILKYNRFKVKRMQKEINKIIHEMKKIA